MVDKFDVCATVLKFHDTVEKMQKVMPLMGNPQPKLLNSLHLNLGNIGG